MFLLINFARLYIKIFLLQSSISDYKMDATYLAIKVSPHKLFSHIALFTFCSVKFLEIVSVVKK